MSIYECERMLSMDWFKKSLRGVKSALGYRAAMASRAVLHVCGQRRAGNAKEHTYFLVTVIRSCVLK